MPPIPWILITLVIILVLLAILVIKRKEIARKPTDYRAIAILGVVFLPIGIATDNYALFALGIIYMIIGIVNKDKWGKKIKPTKKEIRNKAIMMWFILGLLVLGILALFLFEMFFRG